MKRYSCTYAQDDFLMPWIDNRTLGNVLYTSNCIRVPPVTWWLSSPSLAANPWEAATVLCQSSEELILEADLIASVRDKQTTLQIHCRRSVGMLRALA